MNCGSKIIGVSPASVAKLLDGYQGYDATEEGFVQEIRNHLAESSFSADAHCFSPGHAVGSGWIVSSTANAVALIYHEKLGRWIQPGGHCEITDSSLLQSALREVREETSLTVTEENVRFLDLDIHQIPARKGDPEHLHFDFRFLFTADDVTVRGGSEVRTAAWVGVEQLRAIADQDLGMMRMLHKTIERGLLRFG